MPQLLMGKLKFQGFEGWKKVENNWVREMKEGSCWSFYKVI